MSVQQVSFFLLIVGVAGCCAAGISAGSGQLWTSSQELCESRVKSIDSVAKFVEFAKELEQTPNLESKETTEIVNECLQSYDGQQDVWDLYEIVKRAQTVHSVCEKNFVGALLEFNDHIQNYGSRAKEDRTTHGLLHFTSLLYGQINLTCKRSVETKLEQAEQSGGEDLTKSFEVVENDKTVRHIVDAHVTSLDVDLPQNIEPSGFLLFKRGGDAPDKPIYLPLDNQELIDQFVELKRSCQLIHSYAEDSVYPVMKLSYSGYKASDTGDAADNKLASSPRVRHWLKAIQYCFGVDITIFRPWEAVPKSLYGALEPKTFDVTEHVSEIGSDLVSKFVPQEPEPESDSDSDSEGSEWDD